MSNHRLVQWEPSFRKYVRDYEGDGDWSPAYLKREGIHKPEMGNNHYECTCGKHFGTDEETAREHVKQQVES